MPKDGAAELWMLMADWLSLGAGLSCLTCSSAGSGCLSMIALGIGALFRPPPPCLLGGLVEEVAPFNTCSKSFTQGGILSPVVAFLFFFKTYLLISDFF